MSNLDGFAKSRLIWRQFQDGSLTEDAFEKFIQGVCQLATEHALRSVPNTIQNLLANAVELRKVSQDFYKNYSDLEPHKGLVVKVMEQVESKHPGKSYEEIAQKTAEETRRRLRAGEGLNMNRESKPSNGKINESLNSLLEQI